MKTKKLLVAALVPALALGSALALAGCGSDAPAHNFTDWSYTLPTCTQTGTAYKYCKDEGCEEDVTEVLPMFDLGVGESGTTVNGYKFTKITTETNVEAYSVSYDLAAGGTVSFNAYVFDNNATVKSLPVGDSLVVMRGSFEGNYEVSAEKSGTAASGVMFFVSPRNNGETVTYAYQAGGAYSFVVTNTGSAALANVDIKFTQTEALAIGDFMVNSDSYMGVDASRTVMLYRFTVETAGTYALTSFNRNDLTRVAIGKKLTEDKDDVDDVVDAISGGKLVKYYELAAGDYYIGFGETGSYRLASVDLSGSYTAIITGEPFSVGENKIYTLNIETEGDYIVTGQNFDFTKISIGTTLTNPVDGEIDIADPLSEDSIVMFNPKQYVAVHLNAGSYYVSTGMAGLLTFGEFPTDPRSNYTADTDLLGSGLTVNSDAEDRKLKITIAEPGTYKLTITGLAEGNEANITIGDTFELGYWGFQLIQMQFPKELTAGDYYVEVGGNDYDNVTIKLEKVTA